MDEDKVESETTALVEKLAKKLDKQMKFLVLLSVMVLLCGIVVIVQYRQYRIQREQNRSILFSINDCTKPGGECYEAGKRSQILLETENKQVIEHRDRNEELHDVICRREDELADALGIAPLKIKCPPKIIP